MSSQSSNHNKPFYILAPHTLSSMIRKTSLITNFCKVAILGVSLWLPNTFTRLNLKFAGTFLFNCSVTLCDPMDCSMPGFPVLHYLPEFAQTQVHGVGDAIQLSHPLSPPSLPALSLPQHQVFSSELALRIRWPKYCSFSFSIR